MQAASPNLIAAVRAPARLPHFCCEVRWDDALGSISDARGATGWTDETTRFISATGEMKCNTPGDELIAAGEVGTATVTLHNADDYFSWRNPSARAEAQGALGLAGKLVRLWVGFTVAGGLIEWTRVFTGPIYTWSESRPERSVTLNCRDMGWLYLQQKRSSLAYKNKRADEWITQLADLAGIDPDRSLQAGISRVAWAWLDEESVLAEMWEMARADGGLVYFDARGRLRFDNAVSWASHTSVSFDFTESDYSMPEPAATVDDVVTKLVVEWATRTISTEEAVYTLDKHKTIPPLGSQEWECRFNHPVWRFTEPELSGPLDPDGVAKYPGMAIRDYKAISDGGIDITPSLVLSYPEKYAQKCRIRVTNTHATLSAHMVYLQIRGIPIIGGPTEEIEIAAEASAFPYERKHTLRGNPYMQTDDQARVVGTYYAYRNARLRPVYTLRDAPGVPFIELGDRVRFADRYSLGVTGEATNTLEGHIVNIKWRAGSEGFWQDLGLLDATALYPASDLYYIGLTALGAGKCWY